MIYIDLRRAVERGRRLSENIAACHCWKRPGMGYPNAGEKSATSTISATACCWWRPTASPVRVGPAQRHPGKGEILTGLRVFWFRQLDVPHHMISTDVGDAGLDPLSGNGKAWAGRSMVVKKADVIPFECVVRGYLSGSAWRDTGVGDRLRLPLAPRARRERPDRPDLHPRHEGRRGPRRERPVRDDGPGTRRRPGRTAPGTEPERIRKGRRPRAGQGPYPGRHEIRVGFRSPDREAVAGRRVADPRQLAVLAPGFVPPGGPQPSFDKQFVRDWLDASGWDKASPPPPLPDDVVEQTRRKYVEAYETLTGGPFPRRLP